MERRPERRRRPANGTESPTCIFILHGEREYGVRVRVYTCTSASGIETDSNEYRLGESRYVVSYPVDTVGIPKAGAVIDGIPVSFENLQSFYRDRYTASCVLTANRFEVPLAFLRSSIGRQETRDRIVETLQTWYGRKIRRASASFRNLPMERGELGEYGGRRKEVLGGYGRRQIVERNST